MYCNWRDIATMHQNLIIVSIGLFLSHSSVFPPPLSFYLFLFLLFLHLLFFLRILHLSHPSFLHSMIFSYKIQNIKPVNSIRDVCSLPSCSPFFLKSKSFSRSVMSNSLPPWTVAHQSPLSVEFSRQ